MQMMLTAKNRGTMLIFIFDTFLELVKYFHYDHYWENRAE